MPTLREPGFCDMYYTYLNISLNVGSQLWSAHLSMRPHGNIFDKACNSHWQLHMQVTSVGVLSLLPLPKYDSAGLPLVGGV